MRVGFIVTSPYQLFHYERIQRYCPEAIIYIEMREQSFGVSKELVKRHMPDATVAWVNSAELRLIDGKCDVLVCHTPVPLMHFFSRSLTVAQQYSLAKETYQYGVWRAQASLNLMYGRYSYSRVSGFSNAVAVGNPLLDDALAGGRVPDAPDRPSSKLRVLYMPTYGDLAYKDATIRRLLSEDVQLSLKAHHADVNAASLGKRHGIPVAHSDCDPIDFILAHDVIVSDYSGAIFDSLAVRKPVILVDDLNEESNDIHRLSEQDRCRSRIARIVGAWNHGRSWEDAYEEARLKVADDAKYREFLADHFVNVGAAGEACAHEIAKLVECGEPENFWVRQVREANRDYIQENRKLRARMRAAKDESAGNRLLAFRILVLKTIRWVLLKSPGGSHVLDRLRRLRRQWNAQRQTPVYDRVYEKESPQPASVVEVCCELPVVPRERRIAMLARLEEVFKERGINYRTWVTPSRAYCAVLDSELEEVCEALNWLGQQQGWSRVSIWFGRGTSYQKNCMAESLSVVDIAASDSLVVAVPYKNQRYRMARSGGAEVLILEGRGSRLVARRWRADKVDWTAEFDALPHVKSRAGTRANSLARPHALDGEPIDIVYTWVDSADPDWQAARTEWASRQDIELESSSNDERFLDRDELRYSLRSVWLYAPFVRNIFIVTAGHKPEWLDTSRDNIRLVSHHEIFPNIEDLPTFNSHAIEACLHRIPGLSENFIYFNDDVFLGRETRIETYYTKAGLIKSRFSPSAFVATINPGRRAIPTDWASYNAISQIEQDFSLHFDRKMKHVPMPMKRSLLEEIDSRYADQVSATRAARFRSRSDISLPSMFAHYYGIAVGKAVEWENVPGEYVYADTGKYDFENKLKMITRKNPTFICLNVTLHADIELSRQAVMLQRYLRERYPDASPYEMAPESIVVANSPVRLAEPSS